MRGAKPKENKHGRTPTVHEWIEVPNRPYRGKTASLPDKRTVGYVDGKPVTLALHAQTRAWWRDLCSMPHCVLWTATDWRFAVETALVADMFFQGDRMGRRGAAHPREGARHDVRRAPRSADPLRRCASRRGEDDACLGDEHRRSATPPLRCLVT
jgi:hypothetical protein